MRNPLAFGLLVWAGTVAAGEPQQHALPSKTLPEGRFLIEGDMMLSQHQQDQLEKFGGFITDLWPGGVVPYEYKTVSTEAVNSMASAGLEFVAGNPPRIDSAFDDWWDLGFRPADEIRVTGSIANNNNTTALPGYTVSAISGMTLTLSSGDFIVDESALGRIVFVYETEAVTSLNQQRFEAAYQQWEALSNVDFRPRDGEGDYVLVRNTDRNRADVGYQGGERDLQMRAWTSNFTIMHEMAHTLGVRHEQSRPDRDIYVTINGDNVSETACGGNDCISNFNITADYAYPTGDHGLYDFGSIMHYGQFTFAVDDTIPTIYVNEPWTTAWQENIGQRSALSEWDEIEMGYIYPPGNWRFVDQNTSAGTNDGKFTTPYDDWNTAIAQTPVGGKLVVLYPDPYVAPGVYNRPMLIEAPLGAVIKGP